MRNTEKNLGDVLWSKLTHTCTCCEVETSLTYKIRWGPNTCKAGPRASITNYMENHLEREKKRIIYKQLTNSQRPIPIDPGQARRTMQPSTSNQPVTSERPAIDDIDDMDENTHRAHPSHSHLKGHLI